MVKGLDKKGSQYVEASVVLPVIFLAVLSLIGLVQFYLGAFKMQLDVQKEVLKQADMETSSFKNIELSDVRQLSPVGVFEGMLEKEYSARWLKLNEGWAIRAGGLGNALTE